MGMRFRKRIKLAKGVHINLGKKSMGVSIGGRRGGININSRAGVSARVSAPGTGISYTTKLSSGKKASSGTAVRSRNSSLPAAPSASSAPVKRPVCKRTWYLVLAILLILSAFGSQQTNPVGAVITFIAGVVMIAYRLIKKEPIPLQEEVTINEPALIHDQREGVNAPTELRQWKELYDEGLISAEEYEVKKKKLLEK